jgi:hypothetical protein
MIWVYFSKPGFQSVFFVLMTDVRFDRIKDENLTSRDKMAISSERRSYSGTLISPADELKMDDIGTIARLV